MTFANQPIFRRQSQILCPVATEQEVVARRSVFEQNTTEDERTKLLAGVDAGLALALREMITTQWCTRRPHSYRKDAVTEQQCEASLK